MAELCSAFFNAAPDTNHEVDIIANYQLPLISDVFGNYSTSSRRRYRATMSQ